jgi:erythrocyte band 7 integral membrane protein
LDSLLQSTLDEATDPWGVQVERVEVKDVRVPEQLQRAMAAEAEAAREARAKVIAAEGEHKASRALRHAAEIIADCPAALQVIISDDNPFFFLRGLSCPRCFQAS